MPRLLPHTPYLPKPSVPNLLTNLSGLVGYTGGHVLGNFSVTKQRGEQGTGISAKLKDLKQGMSDYQVVVESGGKTIPGGHQQFGFAAKGLFDDERAPGRTWVVTGMGANSESAELWSRTGGRGKTMKFFRNPIISARYQDIRSGSFGPQSYPMINGVTTGLPLGY